MVYVPSIVTYDFILKLAGVDPLGSVTFLCTPVPSRDCFSNVLHLGLLSHSLKCSRMFHDLHETSILNFSECSMTSRNIDF